MTMKGPSGSFNAPPNRTRRDAEREFWRGILGDRRFREVLDRVMYTMPVMPTEPPRPMKTVKCVVVEPKPNPLKALP